MFSKPSIILVNPQMGENIGACARAMMNCGLDELRIVNPRDGWPNERATAMASGAFDLMPPVQLFDKTAQALDGVHFVLATTARPRDMAKPVFTAREAAAELRRRAAEGQKTALLFGAERTGLENDDVALAHGIITIPVNPQFPSFNIAQAVLLTAYEWYQAQPPSCTSPRNAGGGRVGGETAQNPPASHDKVMELFERLEAELEDGNFFRTEGQKPIMIRNLRNMLLRAEMTEQETRTFHGVISALTGKKKT